MSRTERKVRDLVEDDPEMEDALAVVMQRAGDNGGGVEWGDVSDDLSSGQWGRLIEKGLVVDNEDGKFEVRDPEAVEDALSEGSKAAAEVTVGADDEDELEPTDWTTYDKAAGLGVLVMMSGYYYGPVREAVGGFLDTFLGPLDAVLPFYVVILILAMATGAYSTVLLSNLMNTELMTRQQEKMQALNEREKEAKERGDDEALDRIQEEKMEMMGDQLSMFKEQFRPMVWVTLLTIPLFLWLYYIVQPWAATAQVLDGGEEYMIGETAGMVMPLVGEVKWSDAVLGPMQAWIVWYFLCSMGFVQIIRKAVGVQTAGA